MPDPIQVTPESVNAGQSPNFGSGIGAADYNSPPPSMQDALSGQPPQQAPDVSSNPQMPNKQPRLWERVLKGALQGFEMGAIPGAIRGALDPSGASAAMQQEQQSRAASVRFQTAQAANAVAEAGINDTKLHSLPAAIQDEHNESSAKTVEGYSKVFGPPTMVVNNSGTDTMAALEHQTALSGAVPHMLYVNTGKQIIAWDMTQAASADGMLTMVQKAGKAAGNPFMVNLTKAQWSALPIAARTHYVDAMNSVLGVIVPGKTQREQDGQISSIQTQINTVKALPDGDPDKKDLLDTLNKNLKLVTNTRDLGNAGEVTQTGKKAAAEQHAKGKDMEQLLNFGQDANGNKLDLNNASDQMWVDEKTKKPIPLKMVSQFKPSQNERNRADFAKSTLHVLDTLDTLRGQGKLPDGPLLGNTKQGLAKIGLGDYDAQHALDLISLAQSAATGAHVGGKFSNEILSKMKDLISINMNDAQFKGAEQALRDVMQGYVQSGGHLSVAEYRQMQEEAAATPTTSGSSLVDKLVKKHGGK